MTRASPRPAGTNPPPTNRHVAPLLGARLYEREAVELAERAGAGRPVLDFTLNVNPLGSAAGTLEAARGALLDANRYPDVDLGHLRTRLGQRHGVTGDQLSFGCGLDEMIKLAVWAWTNEGGAVVLHVPTFPRYVLECRARGAVVHPVRSATPWETDVDRIAAAIAETHADLAFLCTPNNPTGATIGPDRIRELAAAFPSTQLVVDEAMIFPLEDGAVPLAATFENVAVLRTFSKYYGLAGMRIGYAIADPARLAAIEAIRPPFNVTDAAAAAAERALEAPEFLHTSRAFFEHERQLLAAALGERGGARLRGHGSNMLFLELEAMTARAFMEAMASRGFLVADGRPFGGLDDRETVRISMRTAEENRAFATALRDVL